MKKLVNVAALLAIMGFCFAQDQYIYEEMGYTSLFNGEDLDGWIVPEGDNGHWSVIDGVIDYLHIEWRFKGYGDHLFPLPTILPDGSYLKDAEGKIVEPLGPNSDSGILLKGVGQTNLWCWSVGSGELWSIRNNDELAPAAAVPLENRDKPVGQWNAFDILVQGERITLVNNGIVVIHKALYPGLDVQGRIGLQHHGGMNPETGKLRGASSLVQFRNIWIQEL